MTEYKELGANIAPNQFKRNIIVQNTPEAIQAHRDKYKNTDVFATVFAYDNTDIRNAFQSGSLYFDFDGQTAQADIVKVIDFLADKHCPEFSIHTFYSGNKGFHLEVPFETLGIEPSKELNKAFGVIGRNIKEKLGLESLDMQIYDQVRMWRLPNSVNSKSGLYKIPLHLEELSLPLDVIKEMAKTPRIDFEYQMPELWNEFTSLYEAARTLQVQVQEMKEPLQLKDAIGIGQGSRDNKMLSLAESLLAKKYNEVEVWETINEINRTYKPPLDDNSMQRIFRQATNFIASKTPATNRNIHIDVSEMSQELASESVHATKPSDKSVSQDSMPLPKLLSELSSEKLTVSWIWEGFLAKGHKTLLSALFKAGKSTWIGLLLKAIEHGTVFLGQRTIPCNVLILTEESESQWVIRRDELSLQSQIYILSNPLKYRLSYVDWIHLLEKIKKFCKEKEIGLLIIDTISEFWSVNDENKATEVTQALMPLNYLTEDNIAVLLVHHFRKSGGTQGTATRGSGALASKVDILIDFTRYEDNEGTTKRRLSCLSRFEETPRELVIDYVNDSYVVLGSSTEVREKEKLADLLKIFAGYPNGFTIKEVWDNWDTFEHEKKPSKRTIQRYIAKLIEAKQVEKVEDREIEGKKVPIYKVVLRQDIESQEGAVSQETEAKTSNLHAQVDSEVTHDNSQEHIEANKTVVGKKAYFGQEAIDKLIAFGVLSQGQTTCQNPIPITTKEVWIDNGNGGHDWVKPEHVRCNGFLFWQVGNALPECSTCNSWYDKHEESEITTWYQTKERNISELQPHLLTYAEKGGEI